MYKILVLNFLLLSLFKNSFFTALQEHVVSNKSITVQVDSLNNAAYNKRLSQPEQTIKIASTAFKLAKKANYSNGLAEACRISGIGNYYLSNHDIALNKYLEAINYLEQSNNLRAIGKVYNNIGNLYLLNDYNKALEYYDRSLTIAKKYQSKPEIAGLNLNIGIVRMKKKDYQAALEKFQVSMKLFQEIKNPELIIQCLQNMGEVYNNLKQYQNAEKILNQVLTQAQAKNLNYTIASIKLTLSNVYLNQNKMDKAEATLKSGFEFARTSHNRDLEGDYKYAFFQLEYKKKNYKTALQYLKQNFSQDSTYYRKSFSNRITLASDLFNQLENRRKNERIIAQQKYAKTLFWFSTAVAGLLFALVFLLVINVKRSNQSNQELTRLNAEVSEQKENLNRVNHHLEDIIDERTKDLKIKNKTLSDYSLHLSHQIRGPIVSLKGIVYLEENGLIDQIECTQLIRKCVFEIDDEIISMSKLLNDDSDQYPYKT